MLNNLEQNGLPFMNNYVKFMPKIEHRGEMHKLLQISEKIVEEGNQQTVEELHDIENGNQFNHCCRYSVSEGSILGSILALTL